MEWLERSILLLGEEKIKELRDRNILVVGLGGVGSYAAELIARAGVQNMTIIDGDVVNDSNRNRQLPALCSTRGMLKAEVVAERLRDINPDINLTIIPEYIDDKRFKYILTKKYDYVVDAIDTLAPKVSLLKEVYNLGFPVISSMGAGGKLDPSKVEIVDIAKSKYCKLARQVRKRLHKDGIKSGISVVYSCEEVKKEYVLETIGERNKKSTVGTISYLPAIFGCFVASKVIRDLTGM